MRHKYNAKPITIDGVWYASTAECKRYHELMLLERAGKISALKRQATIPLIVEGKKICSYIADAIYIEDSKIVVEDVKGMETQTFKLKWALAKALFPDYEFRIYKAR